jgi:cytochrome P450
LTRDPESLARASQEVRSAFDQIEDIKPGTALTSCVFTRACIDESMRLAPPIPATMPREVLPGGITIDDEFIPAGIDVGVPHYALMRNPKYFPNADSFNPSRWIESPEVSAESIELARSAFCPFSIGPRGCIAKGLAYVELMIALAKVLWEFDLRREEGSLKGDDGNGDYWIQDIFISKKVGPMIQFRPRPLA